MKDKVFLKIYARKTTLRKNNWLNVCKLPDRRLVAGKQAKHSQIQIP